MPLNDEHCLHHVLGQGGNKNNKWPHFPCKTCLCFNFFFFLNRSMHMAQILEMCIYFSVAVGFVCLIGKDWLFWLSNVQKDWALEGLKLLPALNAIYLS